MLGKVETEKVLGAKVCQQLKFREKAADALSKETVLSLIKHNFAYIESNVPPLF